MGGHRRLAAIKVTAVRQQFEHYARTLPGGMLSQALLDVDARYEEHTRPVEQRIEMAREALLQAGAKPAWLLDGEKVMNHRMNHRPSLQGAVDSLPRLQIPRSIEHQQVVALSWLKFNAWFLLAGSGALERMRSQPRQQIPAFALEANRCNGDTSNIRCLPCSSQKTPDHSLNAGVQARLEQAGDVKQ